MYAIRRNNNKGFTLVEILIVVIILGILAAIVIPQFTNASTDARKNSLSSQLQTMRSQFELYKLQHNDKLPTAFSGTGKKTDWTQMTGQTDVAGLTTGTDFGPYLQQTPTNPLNGFSDLLCQAGDATVGADTGTPKCGFVLNNTTGKIWGTSSTGAKIYDEANPSASTNDE
jgi:general secretion pathway protein G